MYSGHDDKQVDMQAIAKPADREEILQQVNLARAGQSAGVGALTPPP